MADGENVQHVISWYVPHQTPSVAEHAPLGEHNLSGVTPQLFYVQRLVFVKDALTQSYLIFELGVRTFVDIPTYVVEEALHWGKPQNDQEEKNEP